MIGRCREVPALIVGAYASGNLGDVVLLVKSVGALRNAFSMDDVAVYSRPEHDLRHLVPGVRFLDPDAFSAPSGQVLVYGGGTQFYSFEMSAPRLATRVWSSLRAPSRAARAILRRVGPAAPLYERAAALGIGVGPFEQGTNAAERTKQLFQALGCIEVRDPESLEYCRRWDVRHAELGADLCFTSGALGGLDAPDERPAPRSLAAIVRAWPHSRTGAAYLDPLARAAVQLRRDGWNVTFFSFCPQEDRTVTQPLRDQGHHVIEWDPSTDRPETFIARLREYEVLVTARYHGALFAGLLGKPVICIEIEPKLRIAAETLDLAALLWRHPFSVDDLCARTVQLVERYEPFVAAVRAAVTTQITNADAMLARFTRFVKRE